MPLLTVVFILAIGIVIGLLFSMIFTSNKRPQKAKIIGNQVVPMYHGYNGGFWKVNKCTSCKLTGMYEDLSDGKPCPRCGNEVQRYGAAQWNEKQQKWVESGR